MPYSWLLCQELLQLGLRSKNRLSPPNPLLNLSPTRRLCQNLPTSLGQRRPTLPSQEPLIRNCRLLPLPQQPSRVAAGTARRFRFTSHRRPEKHQFQARLSQKYQCLRQHRRARRSPQLPPCQLSSSGTLISPTQTLRQPSQHSQQLRWWPALFSPRFLVLQHFFTKNSSLARYRAVRFLGAGRELGNCLTFHSGARRDTDGVERSPCEMKRPRFRARAFLS